MKKFKDFLKFNWDITPVLMPYIFWAGVFIAVVMGILDIVQGAKRGDARLVTLGIFTLFLGPVFVRVLCEFVLSFFKK